MEKQQSGTVQHRIKNHHLTQVRPMASHWISPALIQCLRWSKTGWAACTPCTSRNISHNLIFLEFRRSHTHTHTCGYEPLRVCLMCIGPSGLSQTDIHTHTHTKLSTSTPISNNKYQRGSSLSGLELQAGMMHSKRGSVPERCQSSKV